jgi:DNA-binding beta-propeller fold protein YncE
MPKRVSRLTLRLLAGVAVAVAFGLTPQLALAQAGGSLTQLASPNNCVAVSTSGCQTGTGMNGAQDVALSPDGKNVYVIGTSDDAVAEFARGADGSLTQIGCIADSSASGGTCSNNATATGLVNPQALVVSPDGNNVYVAAQDANGNGTIAEFARNSDGSLTPVSGHACIAENTSTPSPCGSQNQTASGLVLPTSLAISPDGQSVYVVDPGGQDIAWLDRSPTDGSLSQSAGPDACIEDQNVASNTECSTTASGISQVTGVVVSPHGDNVYTVGAPNPYSSGSIAEFTRDATTGSLTPLGCLGTPESSETCSDGTATGVGGISGLVVTPDGNDVYTASEDEAGGPIGEFSRGAGGRLTQLPPPNDCIQEQSTYPYPPPTCTNGTTGIGIGSGFRLVVSPDGANVYAAAPSTPCYGSYTCSDIAEFARNADGSLKQLPSPDACIQDSSVNGSECPGNENGSGLGGPGLAISPDGNNVYVTGADGVAELARGTHTLTVSNGGTGTGAVADGTGAIACPPDCSHAYTANTQVTLTATPTSGSTFAGWGGACSGTGTCQVTMSADANVSATFTANSPPSPPAPPPPGAPTPVLTGAPTAVSDAGAGFTGSVNPEGLPTTVFFQYGLDKRYSQLGESGPHYTAQTPGQLIGPDFSTHDLGPIPVSGLIPHAVYHVRLVASNSAGTAFGQDVTFTTARAPDPGTPTIGQTFNLAPVSGLVFVLIHGHLVPLTQVEQITAGTVIDSRLGTFLLTISLGLSGSARDAAAHGKAKTQSGQFGGAVVRIHQLRSGRSRGLTTVMMVESAFKGAPTQSICKAPYSAPEAQAARINSRVIQLLHARAHGKFATSGRYSAATVRGTVWTIIARCDGTLVRDIKDEVVVTDFIRHKTILLHAGQSYLAPGSGKT